ncbi:hypothetical protein DFH06DRAFT_1353402 [Mycena polygramma]|nr:hypothetical protein DFH06DRAFT_1353402 [Mycena polygramma]
MDELTLSALLQSSEYVKLAGSRLYDDFAPTRDRSDGSTSVFTYKSIKQEYAPSSRFKGALDKYVVMLFGEMDHVQGKNPAILRLKCPISLKCSAKAVYTGQVKALRAPLQYDQAHLGGVTGASWFGDAEETRVDTGKIYVHLATKPEYESDFSRDFVEGQIIVIWASLERIDDEASGSLCRSYTLRSDFYAPVLVQVGDVQGADYVCDRNAGECDSCCT